MVAALRLSLSHLPHPKWRCTWSVILHRMGTRRVDRRLPALPPGSQELRPALQPQPAAPRSYYPSGKEGNSPRLTETQPQGSLRGIIYHHWLLWRQTFSSKRAQCSITHLLPQKRTPAFLEEWSDMPHVSVSHQLTALHFLWLTTPILLRSFC